MEEDKTKIIPIEMNLSITTKNDKPAIEMRKLTTDEEYIKAIITAAYYEKPLIIQPRFTQKTKAIASLIEKGILFYNKETDKYEFTI